MPTGPENEPEKYTLDEMMHRLKERGHDEGELVTRSDGTVAVKVRKRKRRSTQPHKEEAKRKQRFRILQIGFLFFIVTGVIALVVGMLLYYNSSKFRESTREKIAAWSAAQVDIAEFTVTPNNARFASANFKWPEGNYLRELQITHTDANLDVSSFIGTKWGGSSVVAKTGKLTISTAKPNAPLRVGVNPEATAFPFKFASYRCEKLNITGLGKDRTPWMSVEGTECTLTKNANGAQTSFVGGLISIAGFQQMLIDRGSFTFELGQMKIKNLRLGPTSGNGTLELQNNIDLYSPESSKIEVTLTEFPLEILLGNDLDLLLIGKVDTQQDAINRLISFVPGDLQSLQVQIGFRGSSRDALTLINLPFLAELSREFSNTDYARQYEFSDRVEGELIRNAKGSRIQGLLLEKKGNFIVRGDISAEGGKLGGVLNIGLPPSQFTDSNISDGVKEVFSNQEDGYVWCRVELSGAPGQPQDDFAKQVAQALAKNQASAAAPTAAPAPRELDIEKELDGN